VRSGFRVAGSLATRASRRGFRDDAAFASGPLSLRRPANGAPGLSRRLDRATDRQASKWTKRIKFCTFPTEPRRRTENEMCAATNEYPKGEGRERAPGRRDIPVFSLYGEASEAPDDAFVHIEAIADRSMRYDWEIDRHAHHGLAQVLMVFSGGATVRLDDEVTSPTVPCAVLVPPGTVHAFRFAPGTVGRVLTFAESRLGLGGAERAALVAPLFEAPAVIELTGAAAAGALERHLADIDAEFHERAPGWTTAIEASVVGILVRLARCHASTRRAGATARPEAEIHARFRALVEARFADHLAVAAYAAELGVTESRLDRAVRAVTGRSAFEVTQERLLLEARRKLVYIAAPVSKLAYELGFEDPAYFWRFFRRRTGMTPTEFRKAQRVRADGG
jgi:AraC family transcriptional activator of pobA